MRDRWYGDNRDLVKWGVILHLAREYRVTRILQVAYLRRSDWEPLEIDGVCHPISEAVIRHFRRVQNVTALSTTPPIEVVDFPFSDRSIYMTQVCAALAGSQSEKDLVFLDPDTGLAPKKPRLDHVLDSELSQIWGQMRNGDVLVFYQHQTNKAGRPWVGAKREQFEDALCLPRGGAKLARGPKIAPDVAFFYCVKEIS
jgi:hypothetical protein